VCVCVRACIFVVLGCELLSSGAQDTHLNICRAASFNDELLEFAQSNKNCRISGHWLLAFSSASQLNTSTKVIKTLRQHHVKLVRLPITIGGYCALVLEHKEPRKKDACTCHREKKAMLTNEVSRKLSCGLAYFLEYCYVRLLLNSSKKLSLRDSLSFRPDRRPRLIELVGEQPPQQDAGKRSNLCSKTREINRESALLDHH